MLLPFLSKEKELEPTWCFLLHHIAYVNKRVEKVIFFFPRLNLLNKPRCGLDLRPICLTVLPGGTMVGLVLR